MRREIIWLLIVGSSTLAVIIGSALFALSRKLRGFGFSVALYFAGIVTFAIVWALLDPGPTLYSPIKPTSAIETH